MWVRSKSASAPTWRSGASIGPRSWLTDSVPIHAWPPCIGEKSAIAVHDARGEGNCARDAIPWAMHRTRRGRPPHDDVLTPAEWRTVHAVKHGLTSREIAQ